MTATNRNIEIFSAGCPACDDTIALVQELAAGSGTVAIHDMRDPAVAGRARALGVRSVPAVVVDGEIAGCCANRGPNEATLRAAIARSR